MILFGFYLILHGFYLNFNTMIHILIIIIIIRIIIIIIVIIIILEAGPHFSTVVFFIQTKEPATEWDSYLCCIELPLTVGFCRCRLLA